MKLITSEYTKAIKENERKLRTNDSWRILIDLTNVRKKYEIEMNRFEKKNYYSIGVCDSDEIFQIIQLETACSIQKLFDIYSCGKCIIRLQFTSGKWHSIWFIKFIIIIDSIASAIYLNLTARVNGNQCMLFSNLNWFAVLMNRMNGIQQFLIALLMINMKKKDLKILFVDSFTYQLPSLILFEFKTYLFIYNVWKSFLWEDVWPRIIVSIYTMYDHEKLRSFPKFSTF